MENKTPEGASTQLQDASKRALHLGDIPQNAAPLKQPVSDSLADDKPFRLASLTLSESKLEAKRMQSVKNLLYKRRGLFYILLMVSVAHFQPIYPKALAFAEGAIAASVCIISVVIWRLRSLLRPGDFLKIQKPDASTPDKVNKSSYVGQKVLETTFMNILDGDEAYSLETFNLAKTRTVLVILDGSQLELKFPKHNLPYREYFNTLSPDTVEFLSNSLIFNLSKASIQILPENLPRGRRVSKTYPITLKFENDQGEAYRTIHLFPRTSREKEKWFKKLYEMIHFARGKKIPYSQTYDEYLKLRHMRQGSGDYDDLADFLNVILSRAWFNLRDSKNFHKFIHKKLSHVIRRTKVAKFFRHVSVTELKLSDLLPNILHTYPPYQDERGMWLDMDLDFDSKFILVVKAHGLKISNWLQQKFSAISQEGSISINESVHTNDALQEWVIDKALPMEQPILMKIAVSKGRGRMALNFAPPPSDRLWYAFRTPPLLEITLQPEVGNSLLLYNNEKMMTQGGLSALDIGLLYSFVFALESQLKKFINRRIVLPNMEDIVLPIYYKPEWEKEEKQKFFNKRK